MIIPGTAFSIDTTGWASGPWYQREALRLIDAGHVQPIGSRDGRDLYLLRCWLSTPKRGPDGRWDSADSVLLHFFLRPDDDGALHDHPWWFRSTVLAGSLHEHLPPIGWMMGGPGPSPSARMVSHWQGESYDREAADLHRVGIIEPDTVTLVATGPRVRDWFFHPEGEQPVPWREYLERKAVQA